MTLTPTQLVVNRLTDVGCGPKKNGKGWAARCPAHEDRNPSLSVDEGDDNQALICCHAGCDTDLILQKLSLTHADLFERRNGTSDRTIVATYRYVDEDGRLLFEVVRYQPKDFRQRRPDGNGGWIWKLGDTRRVLYRTPKIVEAIAAGEPIFVVEGEKDVHAIEAAGEVATCNPGGAGKWRAEHTTQLTGADVVVVADRDGTGRAHARAVAAALRPVAASVRLCEPAEGKDVTDHLAARHSLEELVVLDPDDEPAGDGEEEAPAARLVIISAAELVAQVNAMPPAEWLVKTLWPSDAHGVLAAEWKAGKTWAALDLAVSVASGTPWMGAFDVERQGNVLVFLGEGGQRKMERRLQAICASRNLRLEDLPIRLCFRVPHLSDLGHLAEVATELDATPAALMLLDPLYLAARGAKASQLYEMGAHLEAVQTLTQDASAALSVITHWNRGSGTGSARMTGAGPAEWGRILVNMSVRSKNTDPQAGRSRVVLDLAAEGDEIPDLSVRIIRQVWADNPDDLASTLHYEVAVATDDDHDDTLSKLPPAAKRTLEILEQATDWLNVRQIGDRLADGGWPLKERTIQTALGTLKTDGLAVSFGSDGTAYSWRLAALAGDEVKP